MAEESDPRPAVSAGESVVEPPRSRRGKRRVVFAALAAGMVLAPASARADGAKLACIDANTKAQDLRREGKFAAARERLQTCSDPRCPAMVRDDCAERLADLEKAQPSLVFEVKDASGADLIDVRVSVDGQRLADHVDGRPVNVDPGVHRFTFEAAGSPMVEQRLVIREGEAGRHDAVTIPRGASLPPASSAPPVAPSPPPPAEVPPSSAGRGTGRVLGWSIATVGVAGLGVGAVFGVLTSSAWSDAKKACGGDTSRCIDVPAGQAHRATAQSDATVSTVAFVAGGALAATGVVLLLFAPKHEAQGVAVTATVGVGQAGLAMSGRF